MRPTGTATLPTVSPVAGPSSGRLRGMASTVEELLDKFLFESQSTVERGAKFERLIKAFLLRAIDLRLLDSLITADDQI